MKSVAFFTNKGGVGKTTLVCNLAAYLATKKNYKILLIDADPQANATQYMFPDRTLGKIYDKNIEYSIYSMAKPIVQGKGYSDKYHFERSASFGVDVLLGDPRLALIEDTLAADWSLGGVRGLRTTYLFKKIQEKLQEYDFVFYDMGPSLGSINRSVLIGCDFFLIPLSIDLFSIKATENISSWMAEWKKRLDLQVQSISDLEDLEVKDISFNLQLLGYVSQQYTAKKDGSGNKRAVKAYEKIMKDIPKAIEHNILSDRRSKISVAEYELGQIPNLHSLIPMSQTSRKPIFSLKSADGIVGAHFTKVAEAELLFESIAGNFLRNVSTLS